MEEGFVPQTQRTCGHEQRVHTDPVTETEADVLGRAHTWGHPRRAWLPCVLTWAGESHLIEASSPHPSTFPPELGGTPPPAPSERGSQRREPTAGLLRGLLAAGKPLRCWVRGEGGCSPQEPDHLRVTPRERQTAPGTGDQSRLQAQHHGQTQNQESTAALHQQNNQSKEGLGLSQ